MQDCLVARRGMGKNTRRCFGGRCRDYKHSQASANIVIKFSVSDIRYSENGSHFQASIRNFIFHWLGIKKNLRRTTWNKCHTVRNHRIVFGIFRIVFHPPTLLSLTASRIRKNIIPCVRKSAGYNGNYKWIYDSWNCIYSKPNVEKNKQKCFGFLSRCFIEKNIRHLVKNTSHIF